MTFCTDLFDLDHRRIKRMCKKLCFTSWYGRFIKIRSYNVIKYNIDDNCYIRFNFYVKTTTNDNLYLMYDTYELSIIYFSERLEDKFYNICDNIINR